MVRASHFALGNIAPLKGLCLCGDDENAVREIFPEGVLTYVETHDSIHVGSHRNRLLVHVRRDKLSTEGIKSVLLFVNGFMKAVGKIRNPIGIKHEQSDNTKTPDRDEENIGDHLPGMWIAGDR